MRLAKYAPRPMGATFMMTPTNFMMTSLRPVSHLLMIFSSPLRLMLDTQKPKIMEKMMRGSMLDLDSS